MTNSEPTGAPAAKPEPLVLGLEPIKNITRACQEASARSRTVLFTLNVACLVVFTSMWNATCSWSINVRDRLKTGQVDLRMTKQLLDGAPADDNYGPHVPARAVTDVVLRQQDEKSSTLDKLNWNDLYMTTLPVFGIRYCADDMILIGNMGLIIILIWLLFSLRRENHALRDLARYATTYQAQPGVVTYLLECVAHYSIFNTATHFHSAKTDVNDSTRPAGVWAATVEFIPSIMIMWVPAITSLLLLAVTLVTQLFPQSSAISAGEQSVWNQLNTAGKLQAGLMDVAGSLFCVAVIGVSGAGLNFFKDTSSRMRDIRALATRAEPATTTAAATG